MGTSERALMPFRRDNNVSNDVIYDVYISHSSDGSDDDLATHLYKAFHQFEMKALVRPVTSNSDNVPPIVERAIAYSKVDVIIFSRAYANSVQCLRTLPLIANKHGSICLPVYYDVEFKEVHLHEKPFFDIVMQHQSKVTNEEIDAWQSAMFQVGKGMNFSKQERKKGWEVARDIAKEVHELLLEAIQRLASSLYGLGRNNPEAMHLQLEELLLSDCQHLFNLPEDLRLLSHMKTICLTDCKALRRLPTSIGSLGFLHTLVIKSCVGLVSLPESISQLKHLKVLNLAGCCSLEHLNNSFEQLKGLGYLSIAMCPSLKTLPGSLDKQLGVLPYLHSLQELEIDLDKIPNSIYHLETLIILSIQGQFDRRSKLPEGVGRFKNLAALEILMSNTLENLPDSIGELINLKKIRIRGCSKLKSLPNAICKLPNLTSLRVSGGGYLESLPQDFKNLSHCLERLVLDVTKMRKFPKVITKMKVASIDSPKKGVYIFGVKRAMPWLIPLYCFTCPEFQIRRKFRSNSSKVKVHLRSTSANATDDDHVNLDDVREERRLLCH